MCQRADRSPSAASTSASLSSANDLLVRFFFQLAKDFDKQHEYYGLGPDTLNLVETAATIISEKWTFTVHCSETGSSLYELQFEKFYTMFGTRLNTFTTDNLQTNWIERVNYVFKAVSRSAYVIMPSRWSTMNPFIEFALNNAVNAKPIYANGFANFRIPSALPI